MERVRTEVQGAVNNFSTSAPVTSARRYFFGQDRVDGSISQKQSLNLTGVMFPTRFASWMMAGEVASSLGQSAGSYWPLRCEDSGLGTLSYDEIAARRLAQHAKVDSAWLASSFSLAIQIVFQGLGVSGDACIASSDTVQLRGNHRILDCAKSAGLPVTVVGAANATTVSDFELALAENPNIQTLLYVVTSPSDVTAAGSRLPLSEMVTLAKLHSKKLVIIAPDLSIVDLTPYGMTDWPSLPALTEKGGDLWIVPGDRLMCGPEIGLVFGTKRAVADVTKHAWSAAASANSLSVYWMASVLDVAASTERAEQELPVLNLLSTSIANLEGRAARMLPQLIATGQVASGEVVATFSRLDENASASFSIPSVALSLVPVAQTATQLVEKLSHATPAVFATCVDDRVILNLRTLGAHQDASLVDAFAGLVREGTK